MNFTAFVMIKKPTVRAKQWQLDILKKMHAEEARPSTSQRHKLAVETGLDEAWIRNWFMRKNRVSRAPVQNPQMRPGGPLMRIIKLDPPESDTPTNSDASRSRGHFPAHRVVFQGTSDLPTSEALLASVDKAVNSTRRLTPRYSLPDSAEPRSLGYTLDELPTLATRSSSRPSYSCLGKEMILRQNTRTWQYSRDPLHNRYPDFSKFFLPARSDTIGDAATTPELSPVTMSSLTHNPSSVNTALSPGFALSTIQLRPSIRKIHKTRHFPVIEAAPKHKKG
ncbi:hypothetical protein EDD22DRAFT_947481 [Suillus occidentalis]|nr:hypothetical protein EDD22DRAFT_947481 [Suillus occidentalis]